MFKINQVYHFDCIKFMKKISDGCISMILTDTPFEMEDGSDQASYNHNEDDYYSWIKKLFFECKRILKYGGSFFLECSIPRLATISNILNEYFEFVERWPDDRSNVFHCIKFPNLKNKDHPYQTTQIRLLKDAIQKYTNEGDLIFDPFMGTGTTALMAKAMKRNYLGCEVNKKYVEKARNKLAKLR